MRGEEAGMGRNFWTIRGGGGKENVVVFWIIPPTTQRLFPYLAGGERKLGRKERKKRAGNFCRSAPSFPIQKASEKKSFLKKPALFAGL